MSEKNCVVNYEAEYNRILVELEKANCANDSLRECLLALKQENIKLRAIKQTIEIVFGRSFDNAQE